MSSGSVLQPITVIISLSSISLGSVKWTDNINVNNKICVNRIGWWLLKHGLALEILFWMPNIANLLQGKLLGLHISRGEGGSDAWTHKKGFFEVCFSLME